MWLIYSNKKENIIPLTPKYIFCLALCSEIGQAQSRFIFCNFFVWIGMCEKDCGWLGDAKDTLDASFEEHETNAVFKGSSQMRHLTEFDDVATQTCSLTRTQPSDWEASTEGGNCLNFICTHIYWTVVPKF